MRINVIPAIPLLAALVTVTGPALAGYPERASTTNDWTQTQSAQVPASNAMLLAAGPGTRHERRQDHHENRQDARSDRHENRKDKRDCIGDGPDCHREVRQDSRDDRHERKQDQRDDRQERRF